MFAVTLVRSSERQIDIDAWATLQNTMMKHYDQSIVYWHLASQFHPFLWLRLTARSSELDHQVRYFTRALL